jgi:hypothetical protein
MAELNEGILVHPLGNKWVLYAHLPHDTDWTIDSYKKLIEIKYVEDILKLYEIMPEKMITNCMLFLMKEEIKPVWEDKENKEGGCFSYKVSNEVITQTWKDLSYMLLGGSITENKELYKKINGITLSPKKSFGIIKIWMKTCDYQESKEINELEGLNNEGVLFKKHNPEY